MLAAMATAGAPVPGVLHQAEDLLCLDWLEEARPAPQSWEALGAGLVALHEHCGTGYGWPEDYAFGPLPIENSAAQSWPAFWAERRLLPFLPHLPSDLAHRVEALAAALPERLPLPAASPSPCETCATRPCTTACPIGALGTGAPYDVPACQRFLHSAEGQSCRTRGCRARCACPLSQNLQRQNQQAAFHMAAFMGNWDDNKGESA